MSFNLDLLTAAFPDLPDNVLLTLMGVLATASLACIGTVGHLAIFGACGVMCNEALELAGALLVTLALVIVLVLAILWAYHFFFPVEPEQTRLTEIQKSLKTIRRHRTEAIDGADVTSIDAVIEALEAQANRVKERLGSKKKKKD